MRWRLLFLQHPFIIMHLTSTFRHCKIETYFSEASVACLKYHSALVFVSLSVCEAFCRQIMWYNTTIKKEGGISLNRRKIPEMNTVVTLSFCGSGGHWSSIFPICFCRFAFATPCQYHPRYSSPGSVRNPRGFIVWIDVKFQDGQTNVWTAIPLPT